jgi:Secretion system C-terminal sorting domain/Outer membrane protein Omp28
MHFLLREPVQNDGYDTLKSFTLNYSVGSGGSVVTNTVSGVSIPPNGTYNFVDASPYTVTSAYTDTVAFWAFATGDTNLHNDSANTVIAGYTSPAPTKRPVIEETTGLWCGYCVRGTLYMDSARTYFGDKISQIAVHDADIITIPAYDDTFALHYANGYPTIVIDRSYSDDPSNIIYDVPFFLSNFGYADIAFGTPTITASSATFPVTATPAINISGDYRLILVLTEDNVRNPHPSPSDTDYYQHNYYAYALSHGSLGPLAGAGYNFVDSAEWITDLGYNFVARSINPSVRGTAGEYSSLTAGTAINYTFSSLPITSTWNKNYMHAVAMLVDGNTGDVLNSQVYNITLGVDNVAAGIGGVKVYPNPATDYVNVAFELKSAGTAQISIADMAGKVVYTKSIEGKIGAQTASVPTSGVPSGNYIVTISTPNGAVCEHLTIEKK